MGAMDAYLDCVSGAAGDMLLAALLDAGAPLDALDDVVIKLELTGEAGVDVGPVRKGDIDATYVEVRVADDVPHRHPSEILTRIDRAPLPERVRARARRAFELLVEAEAKAHGVPQEHVHFHEVGGVDAMIDVVGSFALMEELGVDRAWCSPIPYCEGTITAAHGPIPLPAPAAAAVLAQAGATLVKREGVRDKELITPTGAAILAAVATFAPVELRTVREGVGAGRATLPWPNVVRVRLGEAAA
jgi:pyridinium-3,5-bisthiocarboxylic acid mononucleotide nickel chelatase